MLLLVQARDGRGEKERERFAHPNHPNGCNSVERLSMTIVSTMNALLCQKYMRENCIHSIKYKYLTVTMYLRYLLISNIKSKKWLEGPNQKLSSSIPLAGSLWVCSLTLSIHINAMYYTHTQFCCRTFFLFIHLSCRTLTVNRNFFAVFIRFDFSISPCYECMDSTFFRFRSLSLTRFTSLCRNIWFWLVFFSSFFATFIFITNCRRYTFRHV